MNNKSTNKSMNLCSLIIKTMNLLRFLPSMKIIKDNLRKDRVTDLMFQLRNKQNFKVHLLELNNRNNNNNNSIKLTLGI